MTATNEDWVILYMKIRAEQIADTQIIIQLNIIYHFI
jgi:hypothetical protein